MSTIVYKDESYAIMGACFEVYNVMGCGFLEPVYQECLEKELLRRSIPFHAKRKLTLQYKGELLQQIYQPDFICFEKIVLEIKAVGKLTEQHLAQVHNYLKATRLKLGLLVNFGNFPQVAHERIVR